MIRRKLGQTGLEVTQIGYGSMGLRGPHTWGIRVVSDEDANRFLNLILDSGINFIDTAPDYGVSEQRIGDALKHRRDEYFLATKCGCDYTQHDDRIEIAHTWTTDVIKRNVETSLRRLQTDRIDLLQFHGGDAETLQSSGLIDQLLKLKEEGTLGAIGSSSSLPYLPGMIELGIFDTFQIPYSCLAPQHHDLISRAADTGAGIIIRGGIAHGGPDATIERPALNDIWTRAGLEELLPDGVSKAQLILRYTLSHPHCDTCIVGTCDPAHLSENLAAAAMGPLPDDLYSEITSHVAAVLETAAE